MASAPTTGQPVAPRPQEGLQAPRFRTHLLTLVLAVALPLALLAAALALWTAGGRRVDALRQLDQTARALQLAVDREIGLTIAALRVLGTSSALDAAMAAGPGGGGAVPFHAQASALVASRPDALRAVWLVRPDFPIAVVNTRAPPGQIVPLVGAMRFPDRPLGPPPDPVRALRELVSERRPLVTDLLRGPAIDWTIVIALPVEREGRVIAVLGAGLTPASLSTVLREQAPLPGTTATLVDRGGVVIARSMDPDRFVGRGATPEVLTAMQEPGLVSRSFHGATFEGERVYGVLRRLETAPLTIAFGARRRLVDAPLRDALALAGPGGGWADRCGRPALPHPRPAS